MAGARCRLSPSRVVRLLRCREPLLLPSRANAGAVLAPRLRWKRPSERQHRAGALKPTTAFWSTLQARSASGHAAAAAAEASGHTFAPENGERAFAGCNTARLLFAWSLLELCRFRTLAVLGARVMRLAATSPRSGPLGPALLAAMRHTAFNHFCAGEVLDDCVDTARRLRAEAKVRCIVDWSVEELEDPDAWDANCRRKVETLRLASDALGSSAAFVPVKLTALLSPSLLERISLALAAADAADALSASPLAEAQLRLSAADAELLRSSIDRLCVLCSAAKERSVPLLLDAEQSNRQPAVHLIARELMRRFNTDGSTVVFDTLQLYLRESPSRLEKMLAAAEAGGYRCAIKLVRGAYIEQEAPLGTVWATKEATDKAYNEAASRLLSTIAAPSGPQAAVLIATHNRASLERAAAQMEALELQRADPRIHFAQILGMVDNLTNALGVAGYNVSKLVVFGEVRQVLPWLLRRVEENRDAFGAQAAELPVLRRELRRRLLERLRGLPNR